MDEELRGILCESKGGYAAFLAQLEDELRQTWARQRSQKPLAQQKASAEAHLKRRQKIRDEAADELRRLTEAHAALETKIGKQKAALAEADATLQQAKLEVVAIAERATAELRGDEKLGSYVQSSIVTAATVKDFFRKLPAAVVHHEEGQQTIMQVMVLLEKLDAAAQAAAASSEASASVAAGGSVPVQLAPEVAPGASSGGRPVQLAAAAAPAAAGDPADKEVEPDEDEEMDEMDDSALTAAMPDADQAELGALRARLKEQGLSIRRARPKGKIVKK